MPKVRCRNGTKLQQARRSENGRSAMSKTSSEAKKRRKSESRERKHSSGEREETNGWNEEDHVTFVETAKEGKWEMEEPFLEQVQKQLQHMMHSEISTTESGSGSLRVTKAKEGKRRMRRRKQGKQKQQMKAKRREKTRRAKKEKKISAY